MLFITALLSLLPLVALSAPIFNTRDELIQGKYNVVLQPNLKSAISVVDDLVDDATFASIEEHQFYHRGEL
jgi:hypothetical protein